MSMAENTIFGFGASRAKAEAVGEFVKLFAGHMRRRESRLMRGAARRLPPSPLFSLKLKSKTKLSNKYARCDGAINRYN